MVIFLIGIKTNLGDQYMATVLEPTLKLKDCQLVSKFWHLFAGILSDTLNMYKPADFESCRDQAVFRGPLIQHWKKMIYDDFHIYTIY